MSSHAMHHHRQIPPKNTLSSILRQWRIVLPLVGILVLAVGLVTARYLVERQQDQRSQALVADGLKLALLPATRTVTSGSQFTLQLQIDQNNKKFIVADTTVTFDKNKFELISANQGGHGYLTFVLAPCGTNSAGAPDCSQANSLGEVKIAKGIQPQPEGGNYVVKYIPDQKFIFAELVFRAKAANGTSGIIGFKESATQASIDGTSTTNAIQTLSSSTITIGTTPTNTPRPPTNTPVPPTNTPRPPTNTPRPPTNTPAAPASTVTPIPPTSTPRPTSTPIPLGCGSICTSTAQCATGLVCGQVIDTTGATTRRCHNQTAYAQCATQSLALNCSCPPTHTPTPTPFGKLATPTVTLVCTKTATTSTAQISWTSVANATNYWMLLGGDDSSTSYSGTATSRTWTGLDKSYIQVRVKARATGYQESDWGEARCDLTAPTNTPRPPTNTPVPPTNTPRPPTNTPVPPTNTPRPPTNTPVPPTSTPIPTPTATGPTATPSPTPSGETADIMLRFKLQGLNRPDIGVPVKITLAKESDPTQIIVINDFMFRSNQNGILANQEAIRVAVSDIVLGERYEVYAKTPISLQKRLGTVAINSGTTQLYADTTQLIVGDFIHSQDSENVIDIEDVSRMIYIYNDFEVAVTPANARYDVDYNGVIDILDVSMILFNYNDFKIYGDKPGVTR